MEKAIEIKRRAQRCIQNGDLDAALNEYEKLVAAADSDPYNFVLIADLLYKKGDHDTAAQRYLAAIQAYEKSGLYKNAIAVCKKMARLTLAPAEVLERLAHLHALDGLATEAALYYQQYADHLLRQSQPKRAIETLRKAFDLAPENVRVLEKLADAHVQAGDDAMAGQVLMEAVGCYQKAGQIAEAERCRVRAAHISPESVNGAPPLQGSPEAPPTLELETRAPIVFDAPEPGEVLALDEAPTALDAPPAEDGGLLIDESDTGSAPPSVESGPQPPRLEETLESTPEAPGLSPAPAEPPAAVEPAPAAPPAPAVVSAAAAAEIERLLHLAQERFHAGDRESASAILLEAARAYDESGQHESAATIYRSLSKSVNVRVEVMTLWLVNCEARNDPQEAAQVACELGDRALNDGDAAAALEWFERAAALDETNETARRRLQRMREGPGGVATAMPDAPAAPAHTAAPASRTPSVVEEPPTPGDSGRIEVAVGRGQAVSFDLGSLLNEFRRGIEAQLKGDAQSHYDLAMTYREMGLLEQAIESFRVAAGDPAFGPRACEMVGRCLLDQGRFEEAAEEFSAALALPGVDMETAINLRYQLGLALEAAGRPHHALAEFERVYAAQANYPDVALKIRVLRKTLESA